MQSVSLSNKESLTVHTNVSIVTRRAKVAAIAYCSCNIFPEQREFVSSCKGFPLSKKETKLAAHAKCFLSNKENLVDLENCLHSNEESLSALANCPLSTKCMPIVSFVTGIFKWQFMHIVCL